MPSRPGSRASRASTPRGSRASRASTPKDEESDLSDTASEAEAEDNQEAADRIAELDELGLARWGPELLEKIDRRCVGALALLRGKSFAGCLRRELQQKQSDRRLLCRYPLGPDELRTVFAYNRHKAILERPKTAPGDEPVPRHKKRDAEAAKRAADAACPEIITVVFFEDVDALMRTALPHCAALRLGEPPVPLRPTCSMDFLNEVCLLENGGLFKLRGYVPSKAGPLAPFDYAAAPAPAPAPAPTPAPAPAPALPEGEAPPEPAMDCALVREWVEGGLLSTRLAHKRRIQEREVHLWATSLAQALVCIHRGGHVFNGPTPNMVQLSKRGPWPADERRYKKLLKEYEEDLELRRKYEQKQREERIRQSKEPVKEKVIGTSLQERAASGGFAAKFKAREEARNNPIEEVVEEEAPLEMPLKPEICYDAYLKDLERCTPRHEKDPLLSFAENQLEKVRSAQEALSKGEDSFLEYESDGDSTVTCSRTVGSIQTRASFDSQPSLMSKASSKKPLERIDRPAWCPEGYEPPEGFTLLGSRSDAWLLGCLLWELSTRIKLSLQEDVLLPRLTPTQEESILVRYCIEQGSAYEQGDVLCEVETEEKIVPFKADRDGVVGTYLLEEGCSVNIGDALFVRNDCLALKDVPLEKTIKQIPARFGVELKNCLRCALEKDPRERATCEEMFYLLEPSRAQRRHNIVELRPKIAQLLDLGTGAYEEEALPLAGRIDREEAEKERQRIAEEEAQKRREEEELKAKDPEHTPEVPQKPKVKLISALLAARFTSRATGEDDGGDKDESELTEAQRMKRRRAEFEASLSPEALQGWKRALARVEKANRKKWYDNLPGVRRRRIDARRARRLRVKEYRRKIKIARRAALMNFWPIDDVVKWAKLACRRAVDCEALSLVNRDGWYQLKLQRDKEQAAAERARNRRARHRKLAAAKAGEAVEEEEVEEEEVEEEVVDNKKDDRKSIMGRQVIPPSETLRLTTVIEEARRTREDRRRHLRKAITENYAERKLENYALAAAAAVDLVWLDHAALRYCEPLGQCLVDKGVTGKKLHFAMQRAAENAERGIKRLSAKGTLDDEASCRVALGVAAVTRSEALKDVLLESVILAEKMRPPPKEKKGDSSSSSDSDSDDDANKVHPEAHEERDRQAFILAVVLYAAFHETKTKALPARVDASTKIASVARGRQTRAVIKEIWRQADVLADDELRADAAAKAAMAAEEARRPKPLPPPPPPLETMQFGARYAVLGLGHVLRKVGERAAQATKGRSDDPLSQTKAEPMSIMGWKGSDPVWKSTSVSGALH